MTFRIISEHWIDDRGSIVFNLFVRLTIFFQSGSSFVVENYRKNSKFLVHLFHEIRPMTSNA